MSMKNTILILLAPLLIAAANAQLKTVTYPTGSLDHAPGSPVVVTRFGVYPQQIIRKEGPFVLAIQNRLPGHTEHVSLTLDQNNAPELLGLDTSSVQTHAAALLDLEPNTYRVRFRENPTFSFTIVIQAKGATAP
jgi:hypothetical protein